MLVTFRCHRDDEQSASVTFLSAEQLASLLRSELTLRTWKSRVIVKRGYIASVLNLYTQKLEFQIPLSHHGTAVNSIMIKQLHNNNIFVGPIPNGEEEITHLEIDATNGKTVRSWTQYGTNLQTYYENFFESRDGKITLWYKPKFNCNELLFDLDGVQQVYRNPQLCCISETSTGEALVASATTVMYVPAQEEARLWFVGFCVQSMIEIRPNEILCSNDNSIALIHLCRPKMVTKIQINEQNSTQGIPVGWEQIIKISNGCLVVRYYRQIKLVQDFQVVFTQKHDVTIRDAFTEVKPNVIGYQAGSDIYLFNAETRQADLYIAGTETLACFLFD